MIQKDYIGLILKQKSILMFVLFELWTPLIRETFIIDQRCVDNQQSNCNETFYWGGWWGKDIERKWAAERITVSVSISILWGNKASRQICIRNRLFVMLGVKL